MTSLIIATSVCRCGHPYIDHGFMHDWAYIDQRCRVCVCAGWTPRNDLIFELRANIPLGTPVLCLQHDARTCRCTTTPCPCHCHPEHARPDTALLDV